MREELYKNLPDTPGVYIMKAKNGKLLYIGKAGNLRMRVSSYFTRPHDSRIERMVSEIRKIDFRNTSSALEALILEAQLIKKYLPPYNVKEKDDKSFLYVAVTKDEFPRVLLVRGKKGALDLKKSAFYGPFVSSSAIREALRIVRRIFAFSVHPADKIGTFKRPCFDAQVGLCPGTCVGTADRDEYIRNIRNIKLIFGGKIKKMTNLMNVEMRKASRALQFETAQILKRQIFAIQHVGDSALIGDIDSEIENSKLKIENSRRVEGYDISNISGAFAVGSMVVFSENVPKKSDYRKFKIKTVSGPDDTGMIAEVISRRFSGRNNSWPNPDLILIDGGLGQVGAARKALAGRGISIPVIGIAKGLERKRNDFIGKVPEWADKKILIRVRDEAHRFAVKYHRVLRDANFLVN